MKIGDFVSRIAGAVRVNRRVSTFSVLTVAAVLVLNLSTQGDPTQAQRLLASLLLVCCALPTLMWASDRQWQPSFLPILGVIYAIHFGLPIFLRSDFYGSWHGQPHIDATAITAALFLALAGWGLLLLGYFGPVSGWVTRKLPRINVLSTARVPGLKAFAVTLGLVAAPFLYLDNSNVSAFYTGRDLLAPAIAFPVTFIGQMTVLSILILFYLQRRGKLGRVGKSFLWGLVAYYTVLGLSTGMISHGLLAIVALYVGMTIAVPVPTCRILSRGVFILAILLVVLIPTREHFRTLIWTHGVELSSARTFRKEVVALSPEYIATGHARFVRPSYDLVLRDNVLTYIFKNVDAHCSALGPDRAFYSFFLHIYPVDEEAAVASNFGRYYINHDFFIDRSMFRGNDKCIHNVNLLPYDVKSLKTGLLAQSNVPSLPTGAEGPKRISRQKTLTSFVPREWRSLDADGEWQLRTRDATMWDLGPYTSQRRLLIVEANAQERRELKSLKPGDTLRVLIDADNWGEYRVEHVGKRYVRKRKKGTMSQFLVSFRLQELIASAGSPSSLRKSASASLSYDSSATIPSEPPVPAGIFEERREGPGRNPWASEGDASQAKRVLILGQVLYNFIKPGWHAFSYPQLVMDRAAHRIDMLLPLAWIITRTPEDIPYLRGETYYPFLFKLFPRFVFPDKPGDMEDFGQRYGFLPKWNDVNAFRPHQISEFYANFGVWGVVLGTFALGLLYRVIYVVFFHPAAEVLTLAAGTHILSVLLISVESVASVSWGFVLWYFVSLFLLDIIAQVVGREWKRPN